MAKNGFKVMDSDMHVFEPADLWQRYIDPKYADRAPKGLNRSFRDLGIEVEGKTLPIPRNPENPALAKYRQEFFEEPLASMTSIRISPRPSRALTTTGCTTSPKRIPSACSALPWSRRTTSAGRSKRSAARSKITVSAASSSVPIM